MVTAMRRTVLLLCCLALTACSGSVREGADPPPSEIKAEVDAVARDVLPDLVRVIGGAPQQMVARFVERGGYGIYDYGAQATWRVPDRPAPLDRVVEVLETHGLAVEKPGTTSDVTATQGNVRVSVSWTTGDAATVAGVDIGTIDPIVADTDDVEPIGPEEFTAYLDDAGRSS